MRKRGWVLPVLAEFFPDNPNLLGKVLFISMTYIFPKTDARCYLYIIRLK